MPGILWEELVIPLSHHAAFWAHLLPITMGINRVERDKFGVKDFYFSFSSTLMETCQFESWSDQLKDILVHSQEFNNEGT